MRKLEYLSPSGIAKYLEDKEEYYLSYLSDSRAPRFAQTLPMSIGSAFDAYVKSFLHERLFGKAKDSRFELRTIFEAQVETHNRDWAWVNGKYAFDCYQRSGALADLLLDLESSVGSPRFEFEVRGAINGHREGVTKAMPDGVVFLGKPDVHYINKHGTTVILDLKVNGFCGNYNTSPKPGYLRLRAGSGQCVANGPHKNCLPMMWKGCFINCGTYLEDIDEQWARQLAIYSWLCGVEVGEECLVAIDQMVCKPGKPYPEVRIAEHRTRIKPDFQWKTFALAQEIWQNVHDGHFWKDLSLEESQGKCLLLDKRAESLAHPATKEDALFNQMTR